MVTKGDIIKYGVLPGIIPRLLEFFRSGFAHVSYLLAFIYQSVGLLPANHVYLKSESFGRFGIRHVVAEAANNLVFSRKHIDQIIVFIVMLAGLVILFSQFIVCGVAMFVSNPVMAITIPLPQVIGESPFGPDQDIAFILLDRVFGVAGWGGAGSFFESCVGLTAACEDMYGVAIDRPAGGFPWTFHTALHRLFEFYSLGIFFVGVFVILYFITTIVAETAQSGTPFGQRFNKSWVPVRLILFLGLLIPIGPALGDGVGAMRTDGLNGAQYILLSVVKLGSNFATNGWLYFNSEAPGVASEHYLTQSQEMVAHPKLPLEDIARLLQFMGVAHTCKAAYAHKGGQKSGGEPMEIRGYLVRSPVGGELGTVTPGMSGAYPDTLEFENTNYATARSFFFEGDVTIRFGHLGEYKEGKIDEEYQEDRGYVSPECGEVILRTAGFREPGAAYMQEQFYNTLRFIWFDNDIYNAAKCTVAKNTNFNVPGFDENCWQVGTGGADSYIRTVVMSVYQNEFERIVEEGVEEQRNNGEFDVPDTILERGWAGAAIWYNKIAAMNGAVTESAQNIPRPSALPRLMNVALQENLQLSSNITGKDMFKAIILDDKDITNIIRFSDKAEYQKLKAMVAAYVIWTESETMNSGSHTKLTGNMVIDYINVLLGTSGIFEMRANADVHPLAQLTSLGKGMMGAVVRNIAIASSLSMGGSVDKMMLQFTGGQLEIGGDFLFSMVSATIGIAAILYYILPLMPFLYFFFALSGWLKSIFEAMVAMPLWALAHLRIDGEGVMGPAAANGYMLIFEIFLRPILIVFGLICSMTTFSAFVYVLNIIYDLVVVNVGGFDYDVSGGQPVQNSPLQHAGYAVDVFFYTAMYAIICYMFGISSFKLVDAIPNQILRWMGGSVATFQESAGDPVGNLTSQAKRSSMLLVNQFRGRDSGLAELT